MKKCLLFAALLFIWISSTISWAQGFSNPTAEDVRQISTDVVRGNWSGAGKMIFWKEYKGLTSYQAVVVVDTLRFTIYVSNATGLPETTGVNWISFWVRPEGSEDPDLLVTWTDDNFDGSVDFASANIRPSMTMTGPKGPSTSARTTSFSTIPQSEC